MRRKFVAICLAANETNLLGILGIPYAMANHKTGYTVFNYTKIHDAALNKRYEYRYMN